MRTEDAAYVDFLERKYLWGRQWYLQHIIFPRYARQLLPGLVYDLGFGSGAFLEFASRRGLRVVGVDSNPGFVQRAKAHGWNVCLDDVTKPAGHFEKGMNVVCDNLLEHLDETALRRFLSHLGLFLSPGGRLLVIVPNKRGFMSDPTHQTLVDDAVMQRLLPETSLELLHTFWHPIPFSCIGNLYIYNMRVYVMEYRGRA